jgi:hypothetical protein
MYTKYQQGQNFVRKFTSELGGTDSKRWNFKKVARQEMKQNKKVLT